MPKIENDEIGEVGEEYFRRLCLEARLVVNPPHVDKTGWDFFIEDRPTDFNKSKEEVGGHSDQTKIRAFVQVKAFVQGGKSPRIKLSNWMRMVESPIPQFVFVAVLNADNPFQIDSTYLLHVDESIAKSVLEKRRKNEVGKVKT